MFIVCFPTPVLLPGKSHGRRSLVGHSPWGREESDMTERLHFSFQALVFFFNQIVTHVPVTVLSVLHVELHPVILIIIPFYR